MKGSWRLLLLTLLACAVRLAASNDDAQLYQELFLTESVYAQEARELQLTLFGVSRNRDLSGRRSLATELEYGITDRLQLSVEWRDLRFGKSSLDPERLAVGVKRSFPSLFGKSLHAALGTEVTPDGVAPYVAVARDFRGRRMQVSGHIAAEFDGSDDLEEGGNRRLETSLAFLGAWRRFRYVFEISWDNASIRSAQLCPGLIVRIGRGRDIGFALPMPMSNGGHQSGRARGSIDGATRFMMYLIQEF
ncbi:MAG: hypothetical protein SFV54_06095 [Bryobacteraceae bacterium]|nr:hypothetical protein [Bryobacteraceae bacterium]